jgi:hypothetical protein
MPEYPGKLPAIPGQAIKKRNVTPPPTWGPPFVRFPIQTPKKIKLPPIKNDSATIALITSRAHPPANTPTPTPATATHRTLSPL